MERHSLMKIHFTEPKRITLMNTNIRSDVYKVMRYLLAKSVSALDDNNYYT